MKSELSGLIVGSLLCSLGLILGMLATYVSDDSCNTWVAPLDSVQMCPKNSSMEIVSENSQVYVKCVCPQGE